MSEFYPLDGDPLFTILSISEFIRGDHKRENAATDAAVMRESLQSLGMKEYDNVIGNARRISKQIAIDHIDNMANSKEIAKSSMVTIVISTHGTFTRLGQSLLFSDGQVMSLYELIQPIQRQMFKKPVLIFVQACRARFNEAFADNIAFSDHEKKMHIIRDSYFMYSSPVGNRAFRPTSKYKPSFFINILAENLKRFGKSEDMESIGRRVVTQMADLQPVDVIENNQWTEIPLIPIIEHATTKSIYFREPIVSIKSLTKDKEYLNREIEELRQQLNVPKQFPDGISYVHVLSPYTAENSTELTLKEGEEILKLGAPNLEGWCDGRKSDGCVGLFPVDYVFQGHAEVVQVKYSYTAVDSDELTLTADEQILKFGEPDSQGWCQGRTNDGSFGVFPIEYVVQEENHKSSKF